MKISLIQMKIAKTPEENLEKIKYMLFQVKEEGTDIVVLPEMCVCPYENNAFVQYAMKQESYFLKQLAQIAKELRIYLVAGSIPESEGSNIYNTSFVFDLEGRVIARHRKAHLFDVNIEGGQKFMESDTFTAGDSLTTFDTPWGVFGLIICYDIRFPEYVRLLALRGAKVVITPAAFNMSTGPCHWELTFKARALDNQIFMVGCAAARDLKASYHSWGHSIVTDPWGSVLEQLDENEGILTTEIDISKVDKIRKELPLLLHRRNDLYNIILGDKSL